MRNRKSRSTKCMLITRKDSHKTRRDLVLRKAPLNKSGKCQERSVRFKGAKTLPILESVVRVMAQSAAYQGAIVLSRDMENVPNMVQSALSLGATMQ